jgi:hypothetical protein
MSSPLSQAERLAQRLIEGEGDEAAYHELRFEAMATAHAWHCEWLAADLVVTFDHAAQAGRAHPETAAIVLGLLRGARLARAHGETSHKSAAWTNPALIAAGITTIGMILAAVINQYGHMQAASDSAAAVQPAVVRPNIQIVLPSTAAQTTPAQTVIPASPSASTQPHQKPSPSALPTRAQAAPVQPDTEPATTPEAPAPETL